MLGTFTDHSRSVSRSSAIFGGRGGSSESVSEQRRPLLLPQELKELGRDKEIIALENTKPILADRICYWRDPVFCLACIGCAVSACDESRSFQRSGRAAVARGALR